MAPGLACRALEGVAWGSGRGKRRLAFVATDNAK
jgi:hypothetical protein